MARHPAPGFDRVAVVPTEVPFICQTIGVPSLFWNRRSEKPSLLKSPVPTRRQAAPGSARVTDWVTDMPFISQTIGVPSVFWNTMSDLPSLLKSPLPTARQLAPGLGRPAACAIEV